MDKNYDITTGYKSPADVPQMDLHKVENDETLYRVCSQIKQELKEQGMDIPLDVIEDKFKETNLMKDNTVISGDYYIIPPYSEFTELH